MEFTSKPDPEERRLHYFQIWKHASEFQDFTRLVRPENIAAEYFSIRCTEGGELLGGCVCYLQMGQLFIDALWVAPDRRRTGVGHKLVEELLKIAADRKCQRLLATTFSFFGCLPFWRRMGFQIFAELPGRQPGETFFYLKRELSGAV